jgi:hypothetical protein
VARHLSGRTKLVGAAAYGRKNLKKKKIGKIGKSGEGDKKGGRGAPSSSHNGSLKLVYLKVYIFYII